LYIFGISSKDVLKLREIDYNKHSTFCERRTGNLLFHLSLNINTYSMQRIHYQRETSDNVGNWIYGMTFYRQLESFLIVDL